MTLCDVGSIATRQGGVVSRAQLLRLGWSVQEIKTAVRARRLIPLYRGVYAVGHVALTDHGIARAAFLAAGPHAVISRHTATPLWTLTPSMPAVQDVTLLRGDRRSRAGLNVHHAQTLEIRYLDGIPVTSPRQTLADLNWPEALTRDALAKRLITPADVPAGADNTRSRLERGMLKLVRRAGLPEPLLNHRIGPYTVDFFWPDYGLVVETDGWATHGYRAAFERDRARDAHLAAAGLAVLRITERRLVREPYRVVAQIAQAAAARAPSASKSSVYGWSVASATGS
jgi:very-short-patch-repair endonuclease